MLSALKLNGSQTAIITLTTLVAEALLVGFFVYIGMESAS
jgi:hypothetical protein